MRLILQTGIILFLRVVSLHHLSVFFSTAPKFLIKCQLAASYGFLSFEMQDAGAVLITSVGQMSAIKLQSL